MAVLLKSFETGGDSDEPLGDLVSDEYVLAQSFQLDNAAAVSQVDIYVKKVNSITDNITVRLETDAAGPIPSGTLVNASASAVNATSNTSYDWLPFAFPASFPLNGSTRYWIVASVPAQSADNRYEWFRDVSSGYAGGGESISLNGGAFSNESATIDLYFRVYGPSSGFLAIL